MTKILRKYCRLTGLSLLVAIAIALAPLSASMAFADEVTDTEVVPEESYYANPAQAAHAAQLADKAALSDEDVQNAWNSYQEALDDSLANPNDEDLAARVEELEISFENTLAATTGLLSDDIEAMRAAGMGWGDIAHELGVHPSVLGLGHTKTKHGFTEQEIAEATVRNTKTGLAMNHETGLKAGLGGSMQGLGKNNNSHAGGNKSGKSGSDSDKGSKGNNGGGNSGGNGGGNSGGNGGGNGGGNSGGGGGKK